MGYCSLGSDCIVTFPPKVLTADAVLARSVTCDESSDGHECRYYAERAWYDEVPSHYFTLGDDTCIGDALPVVHAYFSHRLRSSNGARSWPLATSWKGFSNPEMRLAKISRDGDSLVLTVVMCGCAGELRVVPADTPGGLEYRVTNESFRCT